MSITLVILAVLYYVACTAGSLWGFAKSDGYISVTTALLCVGFGWAFLVPWMLLGGFVKMLDWMDSAVLWRSKRRSARMVWED